MLFQAGQLIAMFVCIVACNCRLLSELLSEMFSEQSNHPQVVKSVKDKNKSIEIINSLIGTNY